MSTWTPTGYPARPGFPDNGGPPPPGDQYRPGERDWPPPDYGRGRDWEDMDRDRAGGWDRRPNNGRSRSPPGYDDGGGRKRRRSPSPFDRGGDRYEPRPRYADDYDAHSRSYDRERSPRRGYGSYHSSQQSSRGRHSNHITDPYALDAPATFKQFAEWFRHTYPAQTTEDDIADKVAQDEPEQKPKMMRVRYEKYKKVFHAMQVQIMFDFHRKAPWFQERYELSPANVNLRKRVRKLGIRGRVEQFLVDLEKGEFDPSLDSTSTQNGAQASNGEAADQDVKMKNEDQAPDESAQKADEHLKMEEDAPFQVEAEDDPGDNESVKGDGNGTERSPRADEILVKAEGSQIMIRTIPPDIGRVKLEETMAAIPGFVYLALGEPMQKRNYYRAGWIKFTNKTAGFIPKILNDLSSKKIDGFKLQMNWILQPFTARVKTTPGIASKPERIAKDLATVKILTKMLEEEAQELLDFAPDDATTNAKDQKLEAFMHQKTDKSLPIDRLVDHLPVVPPNSGSEAVEKRIAKLVDELQTRLGDTVDPAALEAQKNAIALDLYVAYVRAAYHACYYCCAVVDHIEELHRKCVKHIRKPYVPKPDAPAATAAVGPDDAEREGDRRDDKRDRDDNRDNREGGRRDRPERSDEQWLEKLDYKLAVLIDRSSVDPRDYGGKHPDEELSKAVEPHVKQEDEGKFRCRACNKLFKATAFVEKHIANKHPELVKQLEEISYFNNFALDPQRIQPYTRLPPTDGRGFAPQPEAYGLRAPPGPPRDWNRPGWGGPMSYPPSNGGGGYNPDQHYGPNQYGPNSGGGYPPRGGRSPPHRRQSGGGPSGGDSLPPKPMGPPADSSRPRGPLPPPPDAKEDPRAAQNRKVSYHDMDEVAEGDVELTY